MCSSDLSATEIADIVGAPVLTVRTRLFYARKELYAALLSGSAERAGSVAAKISIRDARLGNDLLAEIRAFRIDPLLDLLEGMEQ